MGNFLIRQFLDAYYDVSEAAHTSRPGTPRPTPKHRILGSDPRSPSVEISRTPIQIESTPVHSKKINRQSLGAVAKSVDSRDEWKVIDANLDCMYNELAKAGPLVHPSKLRLLEKDPRSPTYGITRTPIQVISTPQQATTPVSGVKRYLETNLDEVMMPASNLSHKPRNLTLQRLELEDNSLLLLEDDRVLPASESVKHQLLLTSEEEDSRSTNTLFRDSQEQYAVTETETQKPEACSKNDISEIDIDFLLEELTKAYCQSEITEKADSVVGKPTKARGKENPVYQQNKLFLTPELKSRTQQAKPRTPLGDVNSPHQILRAKNSCPQKEIGRLTENAPFSPKKTGKKLVINWDKDDTVII